MIRQPTAAHRELAERLAASRPPNWPQGADRYVEHLAQTLADAEGNGLDLDALRRRLVASFSGLELRPGSPLRLTELAAEALADLTLDAIREQQ